MFNGVVLRTLSRAYRLRYHVNMPRPRHSPRSRFFSCSCSNLEEIKLNTVPISRTRNIGIIAHIDAGKTTTTERMLYFSGKTKRIGNVDEGDTVTDYLPSERERGITIQAAAISIPWNNHRINIIDTPGHADFTFEVIRSLRVLDGTVAILDAVAGVEAQTEKVWKQAQELSIPRIAYINKMDRDGAGFSRTVKEIIQKLHTRVVLCTLPYFSEVDGEIKFGGVIDVINMSLLKWDLVMDQNGRKLEVIDVISNQEKYPEVFEIVSKSRDSLIETLGEFNDEIVDAFLEYDEDCTKIPIDLINKAIRESTINNDITPVFCGSSFKNIGVQPLMDGIVQYLPSPCQIPITEMESTKRVAKTKKNKNKANVKTEEIKVPAEMNPHRGLIINKNPNLTVALAFKVITDKIRGPMVFFRVYSGKLTSNTSCINTRTGKKFAIRNLLLMHGDEPEPIAYVSSGNIGVVYGLDDIVTGDTLISHGPVSKNFSDLESHLKLLPIDIPPPLFNSAIEPLTAGDERYMNECIQALLREDPSLKVHVDEEMGQTILSGMGELHLDIVKERLIKDMKAKVNLRDIVVSYKETIAHPTYKAHTVTSDDSLASVEVVLESFEGDALDSDYANEEGCEILAQDNNIVILEPSATPKAVLDAIGERRWKHEKSLDELHDVLIQGVSIGTQLGGPIVGLPLHSTVVRIKAWNFPVEDANYPESILLDISRRAVIQAIHELSANSNAFTLLEPIMETKVYVESTHVGEVSHDLSARCQATILAVEDQGLDDVDVVNWAMKESEKVYLPEDYTMKKNTANTEVANKKVIVAETPLKEMIGYLSKLRSITQGRSTFDMTYSGMKRTGHTRLNQIIKQA